MAHAAIASPLAALVSDALLLEQDAMVGPGVVSEMVSTIQDTLAADADSFVFFAVQISTAAQGTGLYNTTPRHESITEAPANPAPMLVLTASAAIMDPGAGVTAWGVSAQWSGPAATAALLDFYISGLGGLGVESGFNIEIVFEGSWTEDLQEAFIVASEYLSSIITGDVRGGGAFGVDDIRITARLEDIDGPGGVLGQAGPTGARFFSKLPTTGIMEFDTADAEDFDAAGLFDDIVLHEMIHCLGFGTVWDLLDLTAGRVLFGNLVYTGGNAILAYNTVFSDLAADDPKSSRGVPLETQGGAGTAGSHWDDALFGTELMTGFIDDTNTVSAMTVAALEDLGYDTIWDPDNPAATIPQPDDLLV